MTTPAPRTPREIAMAALAAGESQAEAARLAGVNRSTVLRWARGEGGGSGAPKPPKPPLPPPSMGGVEALRVSQAALAAEVKVAERVEPDPPKARSPEEELQASHKAAHRLASQAAPMALSKWVKAVSAGEVVPTVQDVQRLVEISRALEDRLPKQRKIGLTRDGATALDLLTRLRDSVARAQPKRIAHAPEAEASARADAVDPARPAEPGAPDQRATG